MISGRAKLAGVMGWPVGHSLSPVLHGYWLATLGVDGAYVPLAVRPEDFSGALRMLPKLGFAGANVTIPHKQAATHAVDELDDVARRIGAVNTVVVRPDGALKGFNTDAFGFIENIRWRHPAWNAAAGPALVIGAGGAARAVVVALLDAGVPAIRLVNRTRERAATLAFSLGGAIEVRDWETRALALEDTALVVNTTSLGMTGQPPLELDLRHLPRDSAVCDIVYVPLETELLKAAKSAGHPTIDGIGMLLHQARPGFAAWFGLEPTVDDGLLKHVLAAGAAGT
jgi:shikimate dehydrogenase